jgi:hypothetical protein
VGKSSTHSLPFYITLANSHSIAIGTVALTGPTGDLNAQGQALLARTLLAAFGVLPYPGYRP